MQHHMKYVTVIVVAVAACSAFRLIGIGMGTWALAVLGCGLSMGFKSLIFCRMLVGVGEASFVALAAPFIGETAVPSMCAVTEPVMCAAAAPGAGITGWSCGFNPDAAALSTQGWSVLVLAVVRLSVLRLSVLVLAAGRCVAA
eukprot:GHRQ01030052.1.p2 GENE.GHRQ01030052.1~~GHRQ01030052.1.p2  ORF type:complete len:143 (+),score=35.47 GHRQ01030052.1:111-539(+)